MIDGIGYGPVSGYLTNSLISSYISLLSHDWQTLGALQPHIVKDFLQRSNIEIHTVQCGELPVLKESLPSLFNSHTQTDLSHITGNSNSGSKASNTEAVRVAMFSAQNWSRLCDHDVGNFLSPPPYYWNTSEVQLPATTIHTPASKHQQWIPPAAGNSGSGRNHQILSPQAPIYNSISQGRRGMSCTRLCFHYRHG